MKGIMGSMDIPFSEKYDEEDDIYYVSFNTGEPSYAEEVDDIFILELGVFSNSPTGFRILNFHKNKVGAVLFPKVQRTIHGIISDAHKTSEKSLKEREGQVRQVLQGVLTP